MGWAEGRHALITGGGSGIGEAIAVALAKEGAKVSLLGRRRDVLEAVAARTGGTAIVCDITDRDAQQAAFDAARAAHGPLDFAILNAGIADSAPFGRTSRASFDAIIATNLTAAFDGAQIALPDLLAGDGKRLVFIASVAGLKGSAYAAPYVASKHGVIGLMKSLAIEFAKSGMTVNAVCPSFVDTPMVDASVARVADRSGRDPEQARAAITAMNANDRLITSAEVAAATLFLCRPDSRSINGAVLTIDGGTSA